MKKSFLSIGVSIALCGSLYGYDYNIVDGNQMLGAVIDIKDMTAFDNKCVNFVYHVDYTYGENYLVHNANQTLSGYDDLTELQQGQGFIVNATGGCTVTIQDPIVFKGYTYSTIKSPSGKTWLDRNLGATKVCDKKRSEFASDLDYENSQKDCFGDYYQWGREADGHQFKTSLTTTSLKNYLLNNGNNFVLNNSSSTYYDWLSPTLTTNQKDIDGKKRSIYWQTTDGTSVCPVGFRVPTIGELTNEAPNINLLKFPNSGYRASYTNSIYGKGAYGSVWSNTPSNTYYANSYTVYENSSNSLTGENRAEGKAVRCIKN